MSNIEINELRASSTIREMLSSLLIETVANGGSVSFMHPLQPEAAEGFWSKALAAATRGERMFWVPGIARDSSEPSPCCSTVRPTSRIGRKSPNWMTCLSHRGKVWLRR